MGRIKTRKVTRHISASSRTETVSLGMLIKGTGPGVLSDAEKISLAMNPTVGKKKEVPGRTYSGDAEFLSYDDAEYLYLTNNYITRGVNTNAAAIMRNGLEIIPTNTSDQKDLDLILQKNDIDLLVYEIAKNCELYGTQFVEIYQDPEAETVRFELLPTAEMDYLRDSSQKVLYDKKTGRPQGYKQKRQGNPVAEWSGKDALRIAEFKYNTLGGCIEGIPGIQATSFAASEYGYIRNSIADSFIRSLPVAHVKVDGATPEDIEEVTAAVNDRFTARTTYVTSERFELNNSSPRNDIDVFKFVEPPLADIAAGFYMPIEMLASTQYIKSDDFNDRKREWIEHIKVKQKIIASIFEHQVFSVLFEEPVKVRFNTPETVTTTELIDSVSFAVQSGAITPEQALEILLKNQVFGPFSNSLATDKSSTKKSAVVEKSAGKEPSDDVDQPAE